MHIKSDAGHSTNITQRDYIKSYFSDCDIDLGTNPINTNNLTIYPNPTNGDVLITTLKEFNEVRVYSTNGVLLIKSNSQALTVSSLPSGIYLFEVEFKDSITQRRIVKK